MARAERVEATRSSSSRTRARRSPRPIPCRCIALTHCTTGTPRTNALCYGLRSFYDIFRSFHDMNAADLGRPAYACTDGFSRKARFGPLYSADRTVAQDVRHGSFGKKIPNFRNIRWFHRPLTRTPVRKETRVTFSIRAARCSPARGPSPGPGGQGQQASLARTAAPPPSVSGSASCRAASHRSVSSASQAPAENKRERR